MGRIIWYKIKRYIKWIKIRRPYLEVDTFPKRKRIRLWLGKPHTYHYEEGNVLNGDWRNCLVYYTPSLYYGAKIKMEISFE